MSESSEDELAKLRREKRRLYRREYRKRPEVKQKHDAYKREYMRLYFQRPEVKLRRKLLRCGVLVRP